MDIGSAVRSIRKKRNITIAEMSEGTGLSKGFISNMENNHTSPSLHTLQMIAEFLHVPLPYLLLENHQKIRVLREHERQQTIHNNQGVKVEHLTYKGGLRMQRVDMAPGASTGKEPHAHAGEECHVVLQGTVLAEQGEDSVILEDGDSFSWNASVPHYVKNIGDTNAILLISIYSDENDIL
ncbi:transcriptional regulator, XRE family with cupin sensor [Alteribacillus persepolensis]|uniref:Transcriptional regulator, XRE family with cupin sensor n=1 Tax=Alteribacillus persepolensis TaxID=568899 RepID=A0A1G8B4A3_9BACI|nr:XRE family transcriptional regulator [Alteribacillus persepolensis]SDH27470.1 transcriptional regulator, XRE family with cupin sensor [Alteribacillus persepolensis]